MSTSQSGQRIRTRILKFPMEDFPKWAIENPPVSIVGPGDLEGYVFESGMRSDPGRLGWGENKKNRQG